MEKGAIFVLENGRTRTFGRLAPDGRLRIGQRVGCAASNSAFRFTKHLGVLERAGLIRSEKNGRGRTCFIHPPAIRASDQ